MGRGAGANFEHGSSVDPRRPTDGDHPREERDSAQLAATVAGLVQHCLGVSVASHGELTEPFAGYDAGTPYVIVRADCRDECQAARGALQEHAGVTDLAWRHGWIGKRLPGGRYALDLTVFPGQSETLQAPAS